MTRSIRIVLRWIPALCVMISIFIFSAQPSFVLPEFGWADTIMKKGGHMIGYALLALSFWYALDWESDKRWLAWLLAFLYAITDEIHQSYIPGRNPSIWDVLIFDNFGALLGLLLVNWFKKPKRTD